MRVITHAVALRENREIYLKEVDLLDIQIPFPAIISIDGSTDKTGVAIIRASDGALAVTSSCESEKDESPVAYKVRLKQLITKVLLKNKSIEKAFYEEPFIGQAAAAKNLLMLRTFLEELKIENEPTLDYLTITEINNMKWKKLFLEPDACPSGSKLQKEAVRDKLIELLPFLNGVVNQDQIDAIAMGFVAIVKIQNNRESDLKSKKKYRGFMYNVEFIGADSDEAAFQEFSKLCNIPEKVLINGISLNSLGNRADFDKSIFEIMEDDDKLLILKFSSKKQGNIILKHRIGHLAASFDNIYAVVWRKSRK